MKNPLFWTLAVALLLPAPGRAQGIPLQERILSNGMRVLLVERHDEPAIACGWVVRAGSANETSGSTGLAHLFEHMMFKGTRTIGTRDPVRDAELNRLQDGIWEQILQEVDLLRERKRRGEIADFLDPAVRSPRHQRLLKELDALVKEQRALIVKDELDTVYKQAGATGMNANTTTDRTYYHIDVPANKLELWAWLESDRLLNPVFREFYSERDVVMEERRMRVDATPTGAVMEAFEALQWSALPYRWPVIGWPSEISLVTRDQAEAFFRTYYAPGNITLLLVGDFKAEEALPMVEAYFGRISPNPRKTPPIVTQEPRQLAERRMVAEADTTPMLFLTYKTVPEVHRDSAALEVLAGVLTGDSGRLTRNLVRKGKAALACEAFTRGQLLSGSFMLIAMPVPDRAPEDLEPLLTKELEEIQEKGVTDRELRKVKNQCQAEAFARMESNDGLRDKLAEAEGVGNAQDFLREPEAIQAVTNEDVQHVARRYFARENRSVLILHRRAGNAPLAGSRPAVAMEVKP